MVVTAFPFAAAVGISFCDETLPAGLSPRCGPLHTCDEIFESGAVWALCQQQSGTFSPRLALRAPRLTAAYQKRDASSGARSPRTFASTLHAGSWSVINAPGYQFA